ncbi:hypothetical protein ABS767_15130 [Sphingomonas sp. ST-64]|uniref:PH domain-containing protein n=1 Tax=Sphingomonas plantiphila TaxID=3163295 RepID=A0ABW8YS94_9SPHN
MTDTAPTPDDDGNALRFFYHRGVAPMLWALMAISLVELGVVHLLVALLWSGTAALALSVVTLAGLGWMVWQLRQMPRRPVLLDADGLWMRVGTIRSIRVPTAAIAGVRTAIDPAIRRDRSVLRLSLLSHPNVVVALNAPLSEGRPISAIAHRLDDPDAFVAAIEALGHGHDR